jgi:hypothetical protein
MSPRCIRSYFLLILYSVSFSSFSQFTSYKKEETFLRHLAEENLFQERILLLTNLQDSSFQSLIDLETAWTYHALTNFPLAQKKYEALSFDSIIHYNFYSDYLSLHFKQKEFAKINQLLTQSKLIEKKNDNEIKKILMSVAICELKYSSTDIQSLALPDQLKSVYTHTIALQQKSPILAGLYSSIIPGLGKAYYGKKKEAWGAFAANVVFGVQALESYRNAGPTSFRFILFGTGFSLFYLSNIYGTINGLFKAKRDWKNQLHHEVSTYHFITDRPVHPTYK